MFPVICCRIHIVSVFTLEARKYHRSLIYPRSLDIVGGEANDGRTPMISVQAHIQAPFLHGLIVYNIWSPLITLYSISLKLPTVCIEVAKLLGLSIQVLHLGDNMCLISIGIINQCALLVSKEAVHIAGSLLTSLEGGPLLVIASSSGLAPAQVSAIYIIGRRARVGDVVHHDGRVMAHHTLIICSCLVSLG